MHLGQGKMMERWFCTEAHKNYVDLNQDDKPLGHFLASFSPLPSFWIWLRSSGSIQDCFTQPRICYILILLFKTQRFWVFLNGFILLWILSFLPWKFSFIILLLPVPCDNSCWTATHPTSLQSLLLYWLGVRLNIFLCTFPLNKDFSSSALCASVSLHTLCLFFCSNRKPLALEPCPSKTVGSPSLWKALQTRWHQLLGSAEPEFCFKHISDSSPCASQRRKLLLLLNLCVLVLEVSAQICSLQVQIQQNYYQA